MNLRLLSICIGLGASIGAPAKTLSTGESAHFHFVHISAGVFQMGSPIDEANREPTEVQHLVELTHDFEMTATEVTQLQWTQVTGQNPAYYSREEFCPETHTVINGYDVCPNFPVERFSRKDSDKFIALLNEQAADGFTYRRPTEAEWEYAARAGTKTAYYFGNDSSLLQNYEWYQDNADDHTHAVASKLPNPWGLYDMCGNVAEEVQDFWGAYEIIDPSQPVKDPQGPGPGPFYSIRGNAFLKLYSLAKFSRTAWRTNGGGDDGINVGLRLVRSDK